MSLAMQHEEIEKRLGRKIDSDIAANMWAAGVPNNMVWPVTSQLAEIADQHRVGIDTLLRHYLKLMWILGQYPELSPKFELGLIVIRNIYKEHATLNSFEHHNGVQCLLQMMASGHPQKDEVRQVREALPNIADAIAQELDVRPQDLHMLPSHENFTAIAIVAVAEA